MTNTYPTEQQAQEKKLARIYWQIQEGRNELRDLKQDEYRGLAELRAKLTSWPAMLSKRYEVARALALGWWHQLTRKEQRDIFDAGVVVVICLLLIGSVTYLSSH